MIVGLADLTEGAAHQRCRDNDKAPRDRNLATVLQNHALYPHLTVYENITFPSRLAKTPDSQVDERVRKASEFSGCTSTGAPTVQPVRRAARLQNRLGATTVYVTRALIRSVAYRADRAGAG